jgi:hypothetical protein
MRALSPQVNLKEEGDERVGIRASHRGSPVKGRPRVRILPVTNLGWWAVGLTATFFAFVFAGTFVPRGIAVAFSCGLAGGVAALVAVIRDGERAAIVFAAFVPVAIAVSFVVTQLISGNP